MQYTHQFMNASGVDFDTEEIQVPFYFKITNIANITDVETIQLKFPTYIVYDNGKVDSNRIMTYKPKAYSSIGGLDFVRTYINVL